MAAQTEGLDDAGGMGFAATDLTPHQNRFVRSAAVGDLLKHRPHGFGGSDISGCVGGWWLGQFLMLAGGRYDTLQALIEGIEIDGFLEKLKNSEFSGGDSVLDFTMSRDYEGRGVEVLTERVEEFQAILVGQPNVENHGSIKLFTRVQEFTRLCSGGSNVAGRASMFDGSGKGTCERMFVFNDEHSGGFHRSVTLSENLGAEHEQQHRRRDHL